IRITNKKIDAFYCGTGDAFASVIVGNILKGESLETSIEIACDFIMDGIKYSENFKYPTNEGILLEGVLYKLANY
ncbi:MAG: bifunctional hydroxymethylpyrimidine kinase/phosphomethylpyrimidine kinase, partial [Sarcina sp.]